MVWSADQSACSREQVDVSEMDTSFLTGEQQTLLNSPSTGGNGSIIIAEVDDITEEHKFPIHAGLRGSSHEKLEVNPTSEYEAMMQLTQLLDSLICVMDEERRELIHAPTIEDTRPALNLPSCCMKYRIGLTRTLLGTIATVMGTSLFTLLQSLRDKT